MKLSLAKHRKKWILTSMALPGAIWLLLLRYLPMFGVGLAFQRNTVYTPSKAETQTFLGKILFPNGNASFFGNFFKSEWVGFKNFKFLFASTESARMIRNTLVYNSVFIVLGLLVGVTFALMINEITKKRIAKRYQTLMFFPFFISWIVVCYFVSAFLAPNDGLLVQIQKGIGMTPHDWYNTPTWWPLILVISNLWKYTGYSCILYLAAMAGIDAAQYESAAIDGATKFQQILYITLPNIKSMIIILLIMNVGRIFNADFGLFYSVPRQAGPLLPVTEVIDTYVYRVYQQMRNTGMSSAAGLLQNVVGFICIMLANTIVRKADPDSALF